MTDSKEPRFEDSLERFRNILTKSERHEILAIQTDPLPVGIRLNALKTDPHNAIRDMAARYGWHISSVPFCDRAWAILESESSPGRTIEHLMGQYYLQDVASMVPVSLFDIDPATETPLILDMAASPGGKTTHLIDRSGDRGFVIANDASRGRIPALRAVLSTWGGVNQIITQYPGESFGNWYPETFDVVLLDAPCSMENLRPTSNHPLRETTASERARLQERQTQLLISGLVSLKLGGQLVYATCSLAPEEDEAVLDRLLEAFPRALKIQDVSDKLSIGAPGLSQFDGAVYHPEVTRALRLWPHQTGMSGFFCAKLIKTGTMPVQPQLPPSRDFSKTELSLPHQETKNNLLNTVFSNYGFNLEDILNQSGLSLRIRYDQVFMIPEKYLKGFSSLPYEYIGMPLGQWDGKSLEPAYEFVSRFGRHFTRGRITIPKEKIPQWIAGRDIRYPETKLSPRGQYLLVSDPSGRNLGLGKLHAKRLRNLLPRRSG